ncbi:MAG: DUF3108 domain-containing protein [Rikenellaceae bacterium]
MTKKNIFFLLISILSIFRLSAAETDKDKVFGSGEYLLYNVKYKVGINIDVATVSFSVNSAKYNNTDHFRVTAVARVNSSFKWFFDLHDVYDVWIDSAKMRPSFFRNDISEGSYRYQSNYTYNWDDMVVNTWEKNLNREGSAKNRQFELTEDSFDALSMFYKLRTFDINDIELNKPYRLDVVFEDRVRTVYYRYLGKETMKIGKLGRQNTLKFVCTLATQDGQPYEDGNEFSLYLSDDKNMIPLYIYTPISVGSVRVELSYAKGLQYESTYAK